MMHSLTKLVALLSMTGILCLSDMGNATPDNPAADMRSAVEHGFGGAENHPATNENPAWDKKPIDEKAVLNERNSYSRHELTGVYVNDHSASPVPEPEIYAMLVAGLSLLGYIVRRKKNET
jgi:hypothetical protein